MKPYLLRDLLRVVQAYLDAPTTKSPPKKCTLYNAVQSLLPPGKPLSHKWDKTQLSLVLKKWAISALRLSPFAAQPSLLVRVRASEHNAKEIAHSCYIPDSDDRVLTFAMASPSPVKPTGHAGEGATGASPASPNSASEFSQETYDAAFLEEIDGLALDSAIDEHVIPTIFYTPRVPTEIAEAPSNPAPTNEGPGPFLRLCLIHARIQPSHCL